MDFLITPCHTVIGNHLPKAQQGQASVTYTLWPKKCCDHLVWPSAATTTATASSSSMVGFWFTFFLCFLSLYLNTFISLRIPPKINTSILRCPRFSPSPPAFFAPAPTAVPQLFDEGEECHNTLGLNQTQRQAEQTIQCVRACVCVKINHPGFLRLSAANSWVETRRACACACAGGRPAPLGPAIPTHGFPETRPAQLAAKKFPFASLFPGRPANLSQQQREGGKGFTLPRAAAAPHKHITSSGPCWRPQAAPQLNANPGHSQPRPLAAGGCPARCLGQGGPWTPGPPWVPRGCHMEGCTPGLGPEPGGDASPGHRPQTRSWPWSSCPAALSSTQ